MAIQTTREGEVTVLKCDGPLTVPEGKAEFLAAFGEQLDEGRSRLVVDLSAVPYMDSPTIGGLMAGFKRAIDGAGTVKLVVAPASKIQQILELTGLASVIEIFDDPDAAVASFGAGTA